MSNRRIFFFYLLLTIVFIASCEEGNEELIHESDPLPIEIVSITPNHGMEADTLEVLLKNYEGIASIKLDNIIMDILDSNDSIFHVLVPFTTGGQHDITITQMINTSNGQERKEISLQAAFTYLPFEFNSFSSKTIAVHPVGGANDTLFISANNIPKDKDLLKIIVQREQNGNIVSYGEESILNILGVTNENILIKAQGNFNSAAGQKVKYFLLYKEEYELVDLQILGTYRISKYSYANIPENELILYQGNNVFSLFGSAGFESYVYLNGIKLAQRYHDPIDYWDGYASIKSFAIPANLTPGDYELIVYELDGTTPLLSDSTNIISISDIKFCPEKNNYLKGEDININITPDLYPYRCYSCPEKVSLWDESNQSEYVCSASFRSNRFIISPPSDIPTGQYRFQLETYNGYNYILMEDCLNEVITIN